MSVSLKSRFTGVLPNETTTLPADMVDVRAVWTPVTFLSARDTLHDPSVTASFGNIDFFFILIEPNVLRRCCLPAQQLIHVCLDIEERVTVLFLQPVSEVLWDTRWVRW